MSAATYFVYILTNRKGGTLYTGVTNDLLRRVSEHREGVAEGFTKKHAIIRLVHFEIFENIEFAITREKQLKKWLRQWKFELIERDNPDWRDLFDDLV